MNDVDYHKINPSFLLKFIGAKNLNLKIKNLDITSNHIKDDKFNLNKIKKIKIIKGYFLDELELVLESHKIIFKKLTKKQSEYLEFKFKGQKIIKALDDILILTERRFYINHKSLIKWIKKTRIF